MRFITEQQLTDAIDEHHEKAAEQKQRASIKDSAADHIFHAAGDTSGFVRVELGVAGELLRHDANKLRKHALVQENKAQKLGKKLAEFRTGMLLAPADGVGDASVSAK